MSEEKFVGYFRFVEACGEPGCPLCRCVTRESRGYLDALLYEQVTDPDTRRTIRASWGFCNWHTWMLLEIQQAIFGAAIIYADLVERALRQTERLGDGPGRRGKRGWFSTLMARPRRSHPAVEQYRGRAVCPACRHAADTERRCLEPLVTFIDDGDLAAAYARSQGLCLPHLLAAVEANGERPGTRTLVDSTRRKWMEIGDDVSSFVRKHDYRNREPYTPAETASYTRAFEMLVGAKSVFGNDIHAPAAGSPSGVPPDQGLRRNEPKLA